jgi:excisionase family DNA binding protein
VRAATKLCEWGFDIEYGVEKHQPPEAAVSVLTDLLALPAAVAALRAEVAEVKALLQGVQASLPPTLVTITDAAQRLGLTNRTVRRMLAAKKLRSIRIGETVRVDLSSIQAALKTIAALSPSEDSR